MSINKIGSKEAQLREMRDDQAKEAKTAAKAAKAKPAKMTPKPDITAVAVDGLSVITAPEAEAPLAKTPDMMANVAITTSEPVDDPLALKQEPSEKMRTKKTSKQKANANARSAVTGKSKRGAKTAKIMALLKRKEGCTVKDVLRATQWPSISMPATAKAAGIKLRKEKKKGEPTRYYAAG